MLMNAVTRVRAAGASHRGGRPTNQDVFLVRPELGLLAVFDGMGGKAAGEVAASLASDALVDFTQRHIGQRFSVSELLEFGIDWAGSAVFRASKAQPEYDGMGTTVVACLMIEPTSALIGHVGDSRAYLFRDGDLTMLTHDHTLGQELVDQGKLPAGDGMLTLFNNSLTRYLGETNSAQADMRELSLRAGDKVLLCSDGLSNFVPEDAIQRALGSSSAPEDIAATLVELALQANATDNISVIVLVSDEVGQGQLQEPTQHLIPSMGLG